MSATAAAFAESGHGLTGMSTRPRSTPADPMTLGNMRADCVRSLDVSCWQCHHRAILSADPWPRSRPVRERVATPFQTLNRIGNVITELSAGRAVVPPINGSVRAIGRRNPEN
jgi:hypothetical protein